MAVDDLFAHHVQCLSGARSDSERDFLSITGQGNDNVSSSKAFALTDPLQLALEHSVGIRKHYFMQTCTCVVNLHPSVVQKQNPMPNPEK